jgi:hypothetical protein
MRHESEVIKAKKDENKMRLEVSNHLRDQK